MGCASSTPMVATAGSEMLKAATHVKQKGEAAVEDASQTLTTTLDTAKETVGSAVAGITNELGNAFKEGTQALDEAKHKVMEGLHLEQPQEAPSSEGGGAAAAAATATAADVGEMSSSRAPTPQIREDADSLKTSTPEPEIERALATEDESPPTPKPSLEEMAQLSAEVSQVANPTPAPAASVSETPAAPAPATESSAPVESRKVRRRLVQKKKQEKDEEQPRPNTTEWEKFADQLAKSKKFKPYESFAHSQNKFSVYQDHTSLRDKPNHYDGHFSGGNSLSASQLDLSSGHVTPAPARRGQREYAKFVGSEQPGSVSRNSSRLSNPATSRTFDFNPQRDRITLPMATSRIGSGIQRLPAERTPGWGRGRPAPLEEEPPSFSRRMSLGMVSQPLRPDREKFTPSMHRRVVKPISPATEKSSKKHPPNHISSRESSHLEFESRKADKSPFRLSKPLAKDVVRSRESSYTEFDSLKGDKRQLRTPKSVDKLKGSPKKISSRESTYMELASTRPAKSPLRAQKPLAKEILRPRESYAELSSFEAEMTPTRLAKPLAKDKVRSREQSFTEPQYQKTGKSPLRGQRSREPSYTEFNSFKTPSNPLAETVARSREPSFTELQYQRSEKSPLRGQRPLAIEVQRSRESSYTEFNSFETDRIPSVVANRLGKDTPRSREPSYTEFESTRADDCPIRVQKSLSKNTVRSKESSQLEFDSFKADRKPSMVTKPLIKDLMSSRDSSDIEFDSFKTPTRDTKATDSREDQQIASEPLPQREHSPTSEAHINHKKSSVPETSQRRQVPEAVPAVSTSKMPSPATSLDSSNLDVVIQPMSNLNQDTPSMKSFSQSPDQVVMEGYADSELEAALARLEILRGSTATLHSLRSCSPGRHTYTASLLSSRRTSPWVMRKDYGGSLVGKENKPGPLAASSHQVAQPPSIHQALERCDICCNEFLLK